MISIRNIVLLALMQAGVIVIGVLATGLCHRVYTSNGMEMPAYVAMLYDYGVMGLLIPLFWVAGTVALHLRTAVSDDIKELIFWTGVFILMALVIFVIFMDLPLLIRAVVIVNNMGTGGEPGE
jgi:hypothetical protein